MKRLYFLLALLLTAQGAIAQGVKIGSAGNPNPSSMLEVESTTSGFLPPRMTESQRDAIPSPADGLVIFNTTTNCLNFRVTGFWKEVCGTCTPAPVAANAGSDQLNISGTSTTLAANAPGLGTGGWSIISGTGGSFGDASAYNSSFSGSPGTSFTLRWTISTPCGTTTDDVVISFAANWKNVFITRDNVSGVNGPGGPGNLGGINGADNICQNRAQAAGLGGVWKAWISTGSFPASTRLTQYNGEYRLLNGTKVADNWADLVDGSIDNKINVTEYGLTLTGTLPVYTGTNADGTADSNNCGEWTSSNPMTWVRGGNGDVTNSEWTFWVFAGCDGAWGPGWRLYCFEQ